MSYRDDWDAGLARIEALERELAEARAELAKSKEPPIKRGSQPVFCVDCGHVNRTAGYIGLGEWELERSHMWECDAPGNIAPSFAGPARVMKPRERNRNCDCGLFEPVPQPEPQPVPPPSSKGKDFWNSGWGQLTIGLIVIGTALSAGLVAVLTLRILS